MTTETLLQIENLETAFGRTVALGAGLTAGEADTALYENPKALLARVGAKTG